MVSNYSVRKAVVVVVFLVRLSESTLFFFIICAKAVMNTPAILVCYSMGSPGWFSYWVKLLSVENRGDPCITLNFLISLTFFHFSPFCFPCF